MSFVFIATGFLSGAVPKSILPRSTRIPIFFLPAVESIKIVPSFVISLFPKTFRYIPVEFVVPSSNIIVPVTRFFITPL